MRALRGWYLAGPLMLVVLALAGTPGCAGHQAELRASLIAIDAARDGFIAWDDAHQSAIVKASTSLEQGRADLDRYHQHREPVLRGFEIAYKALAIAALEPTAASLGALAADLLDLKNTTAALGFTWPKGSP